MDTVELFWKIVLYVWFLYAWIFIDIARVQTWLTTVIPRSLETLSPIPSLLIDNLGLETKW